MTTAILSGYNCCLSHSRNTSILTTRLEKAKFLQMVFLLLLMLVMMFFSWRSIVYLKIDCATKNGTAVTLEMLRSHDIDVLFGPICSRGETWPTTHAIMSTSRSAQFLSMPPQSGIILSLAHKLSNWKQSKKEQYILSLTSHVACHILTFYLSLTSTH